MKLMKLLSSFLATGFLSTLVALAADPPAPAAGATEKKTVQAPAPAPANRAAAPADPRGGGGGGGGRGNFQGRGGGPGGPGGGGPGGVLDNQQWQLFRESMQKDSEKVRNLDEKLRAAQKELIQACVAATYDEKVVREKAEAVAKIQVEMIMLRAQSIAVVAPTLKPEQKDQLLESRFAIMMLTSGGFGGDPGGRDFGRGPGGDPGQQRDFGRGGPGGDQGGGRRGR